MTINDDRTPEQLTTHTELIVARDKFLGGWGRAKTGKSICAWACKPEHTREVLEWVSKRSDMTNVRLCASNYKPKGPGHFQIYVVTENHPSLRGSDYKTSSGPFASFGNRS